MNRQSYKTVGHDGETEIIIQKSRFICRAKQVPGEEEAVKFIQEVSRKHWDATHNCYAYLITDTVQKSSDDGEPAGTAGRPILEVIHAKNLLYTAIVVTRYFGGIKLGAGGLVRAYSQGAAAAIEAAGIVERVMHQEMIFTFDYPFIGKMEHELHRSGYLLDSPQFTDVVRWAVWVPIGEEQKLTDQVNNWTSGQARVVLGDRQYKEVNRNNPAT
ncbi:YigZ family protein [Paenactinomyces guangxiensis]|uniref:YigZ family protein n=1 Tax=Paenactinomyces guangxiensis TaxID=1490290 RepID=A0A7W1WSR9_9BACL|nr:YigZ family protein [Paenactinomyces guangxiensis]MBA4495375.1 YigZ family protein [Paenactinomyces guangxiensis]MBH8592504.1 YigZ family protein [Paenactinomyces guangxiensis]